MKKILSVILICLLSLAACGRQEENINQEDINNKKLDLISGLYILNTGKSNFGWTGRKLIGLSHDGIVNFLEGTLQIENNLVQDGEFSLDMKTIESDNEELNNHLKSDDFFSVEKYPISSIKILGTTSGSDNVYQVNGDLKIKGITNRITFPAKIYMEGSTLRIQSNFQIDRTRWDIKFGSGSFFEDLGDSVIDDLFDVRLDLYLSKI